MAEPRAVVGMVGKAHGLAGEVDVRPDPDIGEDFPAGRAYGSSRGGELVVAASRLHSGRRLVRFEGVDDRDAAE
ncbi:MAG: ribosome maturation factor RimM, partial [Egibacteraceae bacterium]